MSDLALTIVGGCIAYLIVIWLMARNAPLGHQDSEGWHYGEPGDGE